MKTVICVYEDNHGLLTIAKDYVSALDFLIKENWLEDSTEIWAGDYYYTHLVEEMGEDWADKMRDWDIEHFNDYWENSFYLEEREVYGA